MGLLTAVEAPPEPPELADELIAYCRTRIAPFKVPSVIEFRDQLPKSATGKIRRSALG